jgi:glutamate-ammonia-ligase adenylyltransferase
LLTLAPVPRPGPRPVDRLAVDIEHTAAPDLVRRAVERVTGAQPRSMRWIETNPTFGSALVAVAGASNSLVRLVEQHADALAILTDLETRPPLDPAIDPDGLAHWKRLEFLRIAARDLMGLDSLETVGLALSAMAADVFGIAGRIAHADHISVIGMGKLGGSELNYSSDVDVMLVGDGQPDQLAQQAKAVIDVARRCFRVDLDLRPEGRNGSVVRTLESYEAYWDRWAEPWEFQALLKGRPVAGNRGIGARFRDTAQRWLWSHPFSAEALRSLRELKHRSELEVERKGLGDRELKRGPGGIRDIEFTAQLMQLVHGQHDTTLRSPNTIVALAQLGESGYIDPDDARTLTDAYRFLRTVEHRLQLVDEQQTHILPTDRDDFERLARVMGYRDSATDDAAERFDRELRMQQLAVRSIHERVYFRPLLEAFSNAEPAMRPEVAATRLAAFGFTDAQRTRAAIRELTRGLNRSSRLMQQLLPLLLDWLSEAPDADLGLLMLRNLLTGPARTSQLLDVFRDSPEAARRLCIVLGTSRLLGETLLHNPDLVARLPDATQLATRPHRELAASAAAAIGWRADLDQRQEGLRRWKARNLFGIAARDVFGAADVDTVGADLSTLAEGSLEAALETLAPAIPMAVIAMGRFGGSELSYASDVDVLFVYDGSGPTDAAEAKRVATGLVRFLAGDTPAERIYAIDAALRPEGKGGPLARSLDGFAKYWRTYALVWERQAMTRARPVAGDLALGQRLLDRLDPFVWGDGLTADEVREIRRLKARIERERIPADEDPQFHLKLGRGSLSDIEWTAQLLQLEHGVRSPGTVAALDALTAAGVLSADDGAILGEAYRFCEEARNRWFLVNSAPGDALPTSPESLVWLARSLGENPTDLRADYRRLTRRARRVVDRLFYGLD